MKPILGLNLLTVSAGPHHITQVLHSQENGIPSPYHTWLSQCSAYLASLRLRVWSQHHVKPGMVEHTWTPNCGGNRIRSSRPSSTEASLGCRYPASKIKKSFPPLSFGGCLEVTSWVSEKQQAVTVIVTQLWPSYTGPSHSCPVIQDQFQRGLCTKMQYFFFFNASKFD